jgi:hypothetical protein
MQRAREATQKYLAQSIDTLDPVHRDQIVQGLQMLYRLFSPSLNEA